MGAKTLHEHREKEEISFEFLSLICTIGLNLITKVTRVSELEYINCETSTACKCKVRKREPKN